MVACPAEASAGNVQPSYPSLRQSHCKSKKHGRQDQQRTGTKRPYDDRHATDDFQPREIERFLFILSRWML